MLSRRETAVLLDWEGARSLVMLKIVAIKKSILSSLVLSVLVVGATLFAFQNCGLTDISPPDPSTGNSSSSSSSNNATAQ
jgi:hypothetical protein